MQGINQYGTYPRHPIQSSDVSPSPSPATPISFIGIHDICISRSHFRYQIVSREFTIIGRKRDSFLVHPTNYTQYLHFGQHLSLIHNLSNTLKQTTPDDVRHIKHGKRGIQRLSAVGMHRMEGIAVITSVGIPSTFNIVQNHIASSFRILNITNNPLSYQQGRHEFLSHKLLRFSINDNFEIHSNLSMIDNRCGSLVQRHFDSDDVSLFSAANKNSRSGSRESLEFMCS